METGYRLDWTAVTAEENIDASVAAHQGDLEPLRQMLTTVVKTVAR